MEYTPEKITADHVIKASRIIDEKLKNDHSFKLNPSTGYDVEINGKPYPPKEILRYAHQVMNGGPIPIIESGGEPINKYFDKLEFKIVAKNVNQNVGIFDFNEFIALIKANLNARHHTDNKFIFHKPINGHVWIGDKENIIGDCPAHYEISSDKIKNKITVDIHFEDKRLNEKGVFKSITDNLQFPLKPIKKWFKGTSIRYGDGISIHENSLVEVASTQLLFLEANLGDSIRHLLENNSTKNMSNTENKQPLNQILFGPPGTGKTYNTINKSIAITNPSFDLKEPRKEIKKEFDRLVKAEQIVFTTFHQSMCYEDFIEGIKPNLNRIIEEDDEFTDNINSIEYKIEAGIFKNLCMKAKQIDLSNPDFDKLWHEFYMDISQSKTEVIFKSSTSELKFEKEISNENSIKVRFKKSIDPTFEEGKTIFHVGKETVRRIFINNIDISDPNIKKWLEIKKIVGAGRATYFYAVYKKFFEFANLENVFKEKRPILPHVLIIDEINRGNVSQIFGELITLIEEDKRLGKDEAIEVILPYSKEKFGVPSNVYIIGTMNTADRSVEALDAALRRRFVFEELTPKPELIKPEINLQRLLINYADLAWKDKKWIEIQTNFLKLHNAKILDQNKFEIFDKELTTVDTNLDMRGIIQFNGIDLSELLGTINSRIEKLLDKDHQIGHSYFMSIYSLEDLQVTFQNKIIPLLQEYFFGDYGKIGLVLGKGFVKEEELKSAEKFFADFDGSDYNDINTKKIFHLRNVSDMENSQFIDAINQLIN